MGTGYQKRDFEVVDYQLYLLEGFFHTFRGPRPASLKTGEYFCCLGAAQTFGCMTKEPFPTLLGKAINLDVLNASVAGAGPLFYLKRPGYIHLANQARFVIVQVMSARSESNSVLKSLKGRGKLKVRNSGQILLAEEAYTSLVQSLPAGQLEKIIAETRKNYLNHMMQLLKAIEVPVVLLWFSRRDPDYTETYENARSLFGAFPHLVNREMINAITPLAAHYVSCVSSDGMPQKLFSRFTGKPCQVNGKYQNTYYPSPEMHQRAYEALKKTCESLCNKNDD